MSDDQPASDGVGSEDAAPDEQNLAADRPPNRHRGLLGGRHASAAVIGVLTLLLGFAIVVQVRANSSSDNLSGLREDDLVNILDNQNNRADRLRQQITQLQGSLRRLKDSGDRSAAAREQARSEAQALGVLLGTLPATGPGVRVTVTDPDGRLNGEDLLDVAEELRGAGAEAISFGSGSSAGVRVSTDTAFTGSPGAVRVDGRTLRPPYTVSAIGEAKTLDTALNIPGGVAATLRLKGGELTVSERSKIAITVTRPLPRAKYVKPSR
ncbi:DUF881 domain-containing protein [uncultured Jatrophihabitans sp.]|uniref:DUF881 domain-containing protein n=1 Tax=uncultured Jatrophihabitans sp. TaxID=1610747 RepID=UPI0035CB7145